MLYAEQVCERHGGSSILIPEAALIVRDAGKPIVRLLEILYRC